MKLLVGLVSAAFGADTILPGKCPELPNQESFDTSRYLGFWQT